MNRTKIFLIIILMGLSITGITLMQVHWMLKTIRLNEDNFDRTAKDALNSVVAKLEKEKNFKFSMPYQFSYWNGSDGTFTYIDSTNNYHKLHKNTAFSISSPTNNKLDFYSQYRNRRKEEEKIEESFDSIQEQDQEAALRDLEFSNDSLYSIFDSLQKFKPLNVLKEPVDVDLLWNDERVDNRTMKVIKNNTLSRIIVISNDHIDTITYPTPVSTQIAPPPPPPPIPNDFFDMRNVRGYLHNKQYLSKYSDNIKKSISALEDKYRHNQEVVVLSAKRIAEQEKKQQLALKQIVYEMDASKMNLKDRVNIDELHNTIGLELKNKGITSPFEFALITKDTAKKVVFATPSFDKLPEKTKFSVRLFPNNFVPLNDFLEVKFPARGSAIFKSILLPVSASLFFTLIVFLTFTITLITIIKQKKLADMKADFINNMTHELKTPIATISLASDSIDNPKVVEKPETVKYFTSIIREENSRMNKLVESVLQTARLERKTLKPNLKEVNISRLIDKITDQMRIQAEAKGGSISFQKTDEEVLMVADESLIENVIFNLVDNAIKYSPTPKVLVTLKKLPGGISISVQDHGIGMSRSEQQRVFEKFYRVSQGDVHNIKGFGLGLSNVKEIAELHGGIVQLRSELGKGSTFTLFFPNKQNGNERG